MQAKVKPGKPNPPRRARRAQAWSPQVRRTAPIRFRGHQARGSGR